MTHTERRALADFLKNRRAELGLSGRELARRVGIDNATIALIEQCRIAQPRADTLQALALGLDVPLADLYAVCNYLPDGALPSLRPYMRAKYEDLPEEALAEVEAFVARLSAQYHRGPRPGEDEH